MNTISLIELRQVFNRIIAKLEFENQTKIELSYDFYRFIPTDDWTNFNQNEIILGSLSDDIESLKKMINNPEIPCTYVDFDRLASVLRAISQENNPA